MTQNTDVDLFADIQTSDTDDASAPVSDSTDAATDGATDEGSDSQTETEEPAVETVAVVPDGCMSVTEFAAYMTQNLMREKILAGEDLDMSEYVVPQAVYQTVKAQRDRIPHLLVKGPEDTEARVYIKRDEAAEWWRNRKDRLATRGTGAQRASSRTPEDNLSLLGQAVDKSLYAQSRLEMWKSRVEQTAKLVEKYTGFLTEQNVDKDTVALAIQEATDAFNAELARKDAERAAKKAKNPEADTDTTDE